MSATPIPRTLVLAIFGDLDLSIIAEIPAGRKPITTKAVSPQDRSRAYEFIRSQIKSGRQAFVVCPRIEKAGAVPLSKQELIQLQVKSVKEEYEKLSGKIFPELNIAMLHGKLKTEEKNRTMNEFREGKIQMLVSTSVIEVGVDVPNATMMMIEGAEHFGLAQLYQFRGRVGRGSSQSYCLLFSDDSTGATAKQRLKAIVEAKNGFELAEKDLTLRGPGQFLGKEQTGFPDTLMSGLQNIELLKSSRSAALSLVKSDPTLLKYPLLQERLADFRKSLHQE